MAIPTTSAAPACVARTDMSPLPQASSARTARLSDLPEIGEHSLEKRLREKLLFSNKLGPHQLRCKRHGGHQLHRLAVADGQCAAYSASADHTSSAPQCARVVSFHPARLLLRELANHSCTATGEKPDRYRQPNAVRLVEALSARLDQRILKAAPRACQLSRPHASLSEAALANGHVSRSCQLPPENLTH